jgi:diguanylate cyclase (GGDEF)-like protein
MTGDLVLKVIAHILKSSCRSEDIVARYGGEEFAIILPDTNANEAQLVAERIRTAVENHPPPNGRQAHLVTVSIGISSTEAAGIDTVDNLISLADRALYRAKTEGRNRVRAYKDDPELERPIPFAHG